MGTDDSGRLLGCAVEMALLKRDQKDRLSWSAGYTNRVTVIGPNNLVTGGYDTFYTSSEQMLRRNLGPLSERLSAAEVDMCVLPLCDRKHNLLTADGFPGKHVLRSLHREPGADASFCAADLVDTTDSAVMDNFWLNARNKLRERYKWSQGQFTMIDALDGVYDEPTKGTPYVCVFRSSGRLSTLVRSKSILIIK